MARSTGFEPVTVRLEGGCSIQLSYERRARGLLTGCPAEVKIRVELFFGRQIRVSVAKNPPYVPRHAHRGLRRLLRSPHQRPPLDDRKGARNVRSADCRDRQQPFEELLVFGGGAAGNVAG